MSRQHLRWTTAKMHKSTAPLWSLAVEGLDHDCWGSACLQGRFWSTWRFFPRVCFLRWLWWDFAMAPHSSTLAWKIPWAEEPGGLQSMGSLRVRHDWATSLSLFTFMHWRRKWQPTPVFLPGEFQGREACWASVYGVAQSRTRLKRLSRVGHDWSDLAAVAAARRATTKIRPRPFCLLMRNAAVKKCGCCCCCCCIASVVSDSVRPHGLQPTRLLRPWDFPGRSTGVGCHCLLWEMWLSFLKPVSLMWIFGIEAFPCQLYWNNLGKCHCNESGRGVRMGWRREAIWGSIWYFIIHMTGQVG